MAELGGKQLSTLLESLPGIASVLRSPVADAIANTIRAAAGLGEFHENDVRELLQYATRRGLMGNDEADHLVEEVKSVWKKASKRGRPKPAKRPPPAPAADERRPVSAGSGARGAARKAASGGTAASKKTTSKKTATRKTSAKKAPAKKSPARKTTAKKAKAAPKKSAAKKPARKKAKKPAKKKAAKTTRKKSAAKGRRK